MFQPYLSVFFPVDALRYCIIDYLILLNKHLCALIDSSNYFDQQDYSTRGKVDHLIRMRERLDEHSRFLESQLAGLEVLVREKGELDVVVPPAELETGATKDDV